MAIDLRVFNFKNDKKKKNNVRTTEIGYLSVSSELKKYMFTIHRKPKRSISYLSNFVFVF